MIQAFFEHFQNLIYPCSFHDVCWYSLTHKSSMEPQRTRKKSTKCVKLPCQEKEAKYRTWVKYIGSNRYKAVGRKKTPHGEGANVHGSLSGTQPGSCFFKGFCSFHNLLQLYARDKWLQPQRRKCHLCSPPVGAPSGCWRSGALGNRRPQDDRRSNVRRANKAWRNCWTALRRSCVWACTNHHLQYSAEEFQITGSKINSIGMLKKLCRKIANQIDKGQ